MNWKHNFSSNSGLNRYDVVIKQYQEQIKNYEMALSKEMQHCKKLREILNTVASRCCGTDYAISQLGNGKDSVLKKSDIELRDYIISTVLNQQQEYLDYIKELQSTKKELYEQKKQLGQKVINLQSEMKGPTKIDRSAAQPITDDLEVTEEPEQTVSNIVFVDGAPYDVENEYIRTNIFQMGILKVMGETGLCETNDILEETLKELNKNGLEISINSLKTHFNELVKRKVIAAQDMNTPLRSKFKLNKMSAIGIALCKREYQLTPVVPEFELLARQHATLQHGYAIKETARVLKEQGYESVTYNSKDNQFTIPGGRRYVPDITASSGKQTTYWEVELAHHKDVDFYEKLEKALKQTTTLYIVAYDNEAKEKLRRQVLGYKTYIKKNGLSSKGEIYVGTMTELNKKVFIRGENKIII